MNKTVFLLTTFLLVSAIACSKSEQAQQQPASSAQQTAPAQQEQQEAAPAQQPAATQPASGSSQLPKNGKVVKAMHAGGYTYMQVEKDGREFWIAANMMNVKKDDYVRWADAAVMKNFSSSTLHRTFDEILFVTNAELDQ